MSRRLCTILSITGTFLVSFTGCGSSASSPDAPAAQIQAADGEAPATPVANASAGTKPQAKAAPAADTLHPTVEITTTAGKITLKLDGQRAPGTVRNFLNYVNSGLYDKTLFHYVEPNSIILGGGFNASQEPIEIAPPIRNEAHNGLKNVAGTIAMSRPLDAIDGATSQFFINVQDNPAFDHQGPTQDEYGYCVFGKVTSGLEIVERISQAPVETDGEFVNIPEPRVVVESIRVLR